MNFKDVSLSPKIRQFTSNQILDASAGESATAPTTVAGTRSALIGRVAIRDHALRLPGPENGPPCKVFELPIELPTSAAAEAPTRYRTRPHSGAQNRGDGPRIPGIITLFLERRLPPPQVRLPPNQAELAPFTRQQPAALVATTTGAAATAGGARDETAHPTAFATSKATDSTAGKEHKGINEILTTAASESVARAHGAGRSTRQPEGPPRPGRPPPLDKMQLKVSRAWGLSSRARALDVVVSVMACGRSVGTTRVSSVGGTTSPEWIDEK